MDRSLGFGSTARNCPPCSDSVSLRLRDSYPLTSLRTVTRRLILQKARHHRIAPALTACRSTVSGSLSLPSRGPFHLSLTVLCAIGSRRVFSLGGWSPPLPAGFLVSRRTQVRVPRRRTASRTGLSPPLAGLPRPFRSPCAFSLRGEDRTSPRRHLQPRERNAPALSHAPGLGSSPFARRYWGNLV